MQGKRSNTENFGSQECKQSKIRLTPVKLESKKQDKKILASQVGSDWDVPNERQEEATSNLVFQGVIAFSQGIKKYPYFSK